MVVVAVVEFVFSLLISYLFCLMKSKQPVVSGSIGGGRPLVTGFD